MLVTADGEFGRPGASPAFVRRRIIRIVPLYWLVTTVALLANFFLPHLTKGSLELDYVLNSYLFWPTPRPGGDIRPLATPGWTLNLEMMFYAVFALGLFLPRRLGLSLVVTLLAGLCAFRVAGFFAGNAVLEFWGDPIILGFLGGMGVSAIYISGWRLSGLAASVAIALGFAGFWLWRPENLAEDALLARLSATLPALLILCGAALGPKLPGWRVVAVTSVIGDFSYSLYLTHEFLLRPLRGAWAALMPASLSLWLFIAIGMLLSIIVGFLCWRYAEAPLSRGLERLWPASSGPNQQTARHLPPTQRGSRHMGTSPVPTPGRSFQAT
jgi:exopolysaccharide production protein ExoZ